MTLPRRLLCAGIGVFVFMMGGSSPRAQRQAAAVPSPAAPRFEPGQFGEMSWRAIGPFRGGRTKAIVGVPSQPNVFYIGAVNGGVWKTDDYGRTWHPIFDDQPTGSIGDIAVAPSDPNILYVVSGEGLQRPDLSTGDGVYKSTDGGRTWTHLGLRDGQQLPRVIVDPRNPDRLFVAVLGHPYGPNEERGVFRSTDGGKSFQKVLSKDENTGASDLEFDPTNPDVVYACLWEARQGPWENASWAGTGGGIFKSADGGATWKPLTRGLPQEGVVQADVAIAASDPRRVYASVASPRGTGVYRSDDGGESWQRITDDPRPAARIGGGDLTVPTVDPKNADIVYFVSTVVWKSTDGGKTYTGIRGAPGGDDYQRLWINPTNPEILAASSDQGAVISVNGGVTWSSWYNQPTSQMYHAGTDNAFPYRVCGGQQESGSACVSSRGTDGEITFRDWHPVGVEEYGYAVPDPLNADLVYGGKLTRYDRRTGQTQQVGPKPIRTPDYRVVRTQPVVFSPADPHVLFFASNTLWKTINGGRSWQEVSPDLTRKAWDVPASVGKYRDAETAKPTQRGVIYTVAPSPLDVNRIWAGTDDGLIHLTVDGGLHWQDVTPKALTPWAKVSVIDAGHFDAQTAYAAVNTLRLDELKPYIYRTHDGGKTWTAISAGIPDGETVNAVREDPVRKGLLFAGTERAVYVSFDDGSSWTSLRLNMPATSIRDVVVKNDDLIAATHGRGFWILDDITPLRQVDSRSARLQPSDPAFLFKPQVAYRVRWNTNTDTPIPPDEATGKNPPDGAIVDYWLGAGAAGPVTLEITDAAGKQVRRYSSEDPVEPIDPRLAIPTYWVRPPHALASTPGMHRFLWDLHDPPTPGARANYPIAAVPHDTAPAPTSPWVPPGQYIVKLTANGKTYSEPLTIRMDPRVKTPLPALTQQSTLSKQLYDSIVDVQKALAELRSVRGQVETAKAEAKGTAAEALTAFDRKAEALAGRPAFGPGGGGAAGTDTLNSVSGSLMQVMNILQGADVAPTVQATKAAADRKAAATAILAKWNALKTTDLGALNATLKSANLPEISVRR